MNNSTKKQGFFRKTANKIRNVKSKLRKFFRRGKNKSPLTNFVNPAFNMSKNTNVVAENEEVVPRLTGFDDQRNVVVSPSTVFEKPQNKVVSAPTVFENPQHNDGIPSNLHNHKFVYSKDNEMCLEKFKEEYRDYRGYFKVILEKYKAEFLSRDKLDFKTYRQNFDIVFKYMIITLVIVLFDLKIVYDSDGRIKIIQMLEIDKKLFLLMLQILLLDETNRTMMRDKIRIRFVEADSIKEGFGSDYIPCQNNLELMYQEALYEFKKTINSLPVENVDNLVKLPTLIKEDDIAKIVKYIMISLYIVVFEKQISSAEIFNKSKRDIFTQYKVFLQNRHIIEKLLTYLENKIDTYVEPPQSGGSRKSKKTKKSRK